MAKNNRNKGFSLIEIVIAIAILSLLLIPIINQFTGTMRMNRRSKEQQKANENAQYILEYFKDANVDTLQTLNVGEDLRRTDYSTVDMSGADACKIYVYDETTGISDTGETVSYKVQVYKLENAEIGSKRTEYSRTVYMDDLSACIKAAEIDVDGAKTNLRIAYDLPSDLDVPDGFTRTNEGSFVMYNEDELVTGIVCIKDSKKIDNPNLIDAGNVHSLDSEGVALISGFATDFDDQALSDFYASAMEDLKEVDKTAWEVEMVNPKYINNSYLTGLKKLVKISIDDVDDSQDATYRKCFEVNVDVIYECTFDNTGKVDQHTYNAYNQKFYYNPSDASAKVPFIYFEYQPMVISAADGTDGKVEYALDDYVLVDSKVDDVKLYFFKPRWDYAHKYMNSQSSDFSDDEYYNVYATKNELAILNSKTAEDSEKKKTKEDIIARQQIYYAVNEPSDYEPAAGAFKDKDKVSVHINKTINSKPVNIFTNMDASDVAETDMEANSGTKQFTLGCVSDYTKYFKNGATALSVEPYPAANFKSVKDEENHTDRYYTVSIHMKEVNNTTNTIVLNGAKGED